MTSGAWMDQAAAFNPGLRVGTVLCFLLLVAVNYVP